MVKHAPFFVVLLALPGCGDSSVVPLGPDAATAQQSPGCIDNSDDEYGVRLEGSGLSAFEGAPVRMVTELRLAFASSETCRASAETAVVDGGFVAALTNRTDGAVYPFVGVLIDVDRDGSCTVGVDAAWSQWISATPGAPTEISLTADALAVVADVDGCARLD